MAVMLELVRKFKLWLTILTVLSSESTSARTIVSSVIPIFAFSSILTGDRITRTTGTWIWKMYVSKIRSRTNNSSIPNIYANKYNQGKILPWSNPLSMQENLMKLARPIICLAARMVYNGGRGIYQNQQKRLGLESFKYFVKFWCQSIAVNKSRSM